jgi:competence protein ComEC
MKIFCIFSSLIAGILSGNCFFDNIGLIVFSVFSLSALLWSFFYYKKNQGIIVLSIFIFVFGYLSIQNRINPDLPSNHISNFLDTQDNIITGKIVSFAQHYKRKYKITLLCLSIKQPGSEIKQVSGMINLSIYGSLSKTSSDKSPRYGDIISFKSSVKSIRNFQNPGGFDYKRFLKLKGIYGSAWVGVNKVTTLTHEDQIGIFSKLIRQIEELRIRYFYFILDHTTYSNSGKIMASLVTGKKEIIPSDIRDLFSKAGISHLLAISGLHLSIVSLLFFFLFYRFFALFPAFLISGRSKKIAGVFTIVPLILYGIFTGFSPSCQRALIMIVVLMFSFIREKEKDIISSLSFAGILILIRDCAALFSISFQLSFLAVIFIVYGVSMLKQYAAFVLKKNIGSKIGLMVLVTLFAGLGTSPLTAHYFNTVSMIAPVSNFFAIPVLGFIVLPLGLICLIVFSWFPAFAGFIVQVCTQLISYLSIASGFFISIPFAWSRTVTLQWTEIAVIYLIFISILLILKGYRRFSSLIFIVTLLLIISNFVNNNAIKKSVKNLQITVIDVGQGSSALIQTPHGKNILVDGGGFSDLSAFDTGRYIIAPFLWQKRIKTIDYVILSHPESDHLSGLIFILDNFNVKTLIKNSDTRDTAAYKAMIKICGKNNITIYNPLEHGNNLESFSFNECRFDFFNSSKDIFSYNLNDNSLVFKIIYKNFSMLFPGDILKLREKNLSGNTESGLYSNVMLAPHHGSSSSSTKIFLEKVHPSSVIISCGWQNRYGFPDLDVLKRLKKRKIDIFRTDENGAVMVLSDGENYKIKPFIIESENE